MKGKISLYFNAENVGKVRSRVDNPGKEFSGEIRGMVQEAVAEVVNKNILDTRAILIRKFQEKGYPVKDAKQAANIANPLQAFFDVVVSTKNEFGSDTDDQGTEVAPAEDTDLQKAPEAEQPTDAAPADDEFKD